MILKQIHFSYYSINLKLQLMLVTQIRARAMQHVLVMNTNMSVPVHPVLVEIFVSSVGEVRLLNLVELL